MYVVIKQNRNKRLQGDMLLVQHSLDSNSQSELVLLWKAHVSDTQQMKAAVVAVLCVALLVMVLLSFSTLCLSSNFTGIAWLPYRHFT